VPTNRTKFPTRVDWKKIYTIYSNRVGYWPQTVLPKMDSHFHFLFSWHLRLMTKFLNFFKIMREGYILVWFIHPNYEKLFSYLLVGGWESIPVFNSFLI
jgi:hypothetical protein